MYHPHAGACATVVQCTDGNFVLLHRAISLLAIQMNRHCCAKRSVFPCAAQGVTCLIGPSKRVGHCGQFSQLRWEGSTLIGIKVGDGRGLGHCLTLGKVDNRFAWTVMGETNHHGTRTYNLADVCPVFP